MPKGAQFSKNQRDAQILAKNWLLVEWLEEISLKVLLKEQPFQEMEFLLQMLMEKLSLVVLLVRTKQQ